MKNLQKLTNDDLSIMYAAVRQEILARRNRDEPDPFVVIKGQEHAKRSIVVAAAGDPTHSILFVGPPGCGKSMLVAAAARVGVIAHEIQPCPCGNFTNPRLACKCTPGKIDRHLAKYKGLCETCEIHCEVPPVPTNEMLSKQHGTDLARVRDQLNRKGPRPEFVPDDACKRILKQAITELGLPIGTVDKVISVAHSISSLACKDKVQVDDILEAIHYRRLDRTM